MLIPDEELNAVTGKIIAAAITVHRVLGPGLLESTYAACLRVELQKAQLKHDPPRPRVCSAPFPS